MTTGPSRPNYFILLELNPDVPWSDAVFEQRLKEKRSQWAIDSGKPGKASLTAQQNRSRIPDIQAVMGDEMRREEEATKARGELASKHKDRLEEFTRQLAFINAKSYIEQDELDKFIEAFKDVYSGPDIKARVTVQVETPAPVASSAPAYDPVKMKQINDRLEIVHMSSLYEALNRKPTLATPDLWRATEELYQSMVKRPNKTAEVTALQELAGFAREVFQNADNRRRYDESRRQSELSGLLKNLDDIMSRTQNKVLNPAQVGLFLDDARKQGWSEEDASTILRNHRLQRKWSLFEAVPEKREGKLLCPSCKTFNDVKQNFCTKCKQPLSIDCPDCGNKVSCEFMACGNCGFPVGNRYDVDSSLEEARTFLKAGDLQQTMAQVSEAEAEWRPKKADERVQEIAKLKAEVQRLLDTQTQSEKNAVAQINKLIAQKHFFAARQELIKQSATLTQRGPLQSTIDATITQAQDLVKRARSAGASRDQKIDYCRQALQLCADYKEAQNLLRTMPPSPPGNLQAKVRDDVVSLSWNASPTASVQYRVLRSSHARPNTPQDGRLLDTVTGLLYDDRAPEPGVPLYYAVYAEYDAVTSEQAAIVSQPILLIRDVTNLQASINDCQISLSWNPPPNVQTIVIIRKEQLPPIAVHDGSRLAELPPAQKHYVDRTVQNEHVYHYAVYCQFKNHEGRAVTSPGKIVKAVPAMPPEIITYLDIKTSETTLPLNLSISWRPPSKGTVAIVKSQDSLRKEGKDILETDFNILGDERLPTLHPDNTVDQWTKPGVVYYTPAVIFNKRAYIGPSHRYVYVEDISNLHYHNLGSCLRLQWSWPEDCQEALISYSLVNWPQAGNTAVTKHHVTRALYDAKGYYDIAGATEQDYYIVVSAITKQGNEQLTARGVRLQARLASKMILTYEIRNPTFLHRKRTLHILSRTPGTLPVLLLISRQNRIPFNKGDGELLYRLEPAMVGEKELVIELSERAFPARTFGKLFLENDALYDRINIHHPGENKLRLS